MVVLHRPLARDLPRRVERYRDHGLAVVIDEDDDLYNVPEWNIIAKDYLQSQGLANHERSIESATCMTVTTPYLQRLYQGITDKPVYLCPNHLPRMHVVRMPRSTDDKRVLVNWAGITLTHGQDLEWLRPAVQHLLKDATFVTIGDLETPKVLALPPSQDIELFPYISGMTHLYTMMGYADIGIVPLVPCDFNEAKSWLKALEYMTQGVPVVATDLPEQRALITHGHDGFLASTPQDMASWVQLLVHDADMRTQLGLNARATAERLALENTDHWQSMVQREMIPAA